MQEKNNDQTVNSHIFITTMSKLLMPRVQGLYEKFNKLFEVNGESGEA